MIHKRVTTIILIILVIIIAATLGYFVLNANKAIPLGQQFTLKQGQTVKITNTGLEIKITEFYNSPCPTGSQCLWSGVGVGFEYRFNGEVQRGIDLVQAFGYQTTIIKTDHETYANLVVEKIK